MLYWLRQLQWQQRTTLQNLRCLTQKKAKYEQEKAQPNNDVSGLLSSEEAVSLKSVYSVRVRDQGPDYRCFVSLGRDGSYKCHFRDCITVQDARSRSFSAGALVCLVSMLI